MASTISSFLLGAVSCKGNPMKRSTAPLRPNARCHAPNVVTRELSPLEKVIKSRQYDPKRAKRRSSKRW